jgi:2-desacetyl-2-hydroxyethyl bacteriochlorophyllide A dehydrogenase
MRALVLVGVERVEMRELPAPAPQAGEVLLRVSTAGICGSDIHGFLGHSPRRKPGLVLGHEAVGVVADVGPSAEGVRVGQRVYVNPLISCGMCMACLAGRQNTCERWRLLGMDRVNGAYAEFVAVPASQVRPIPDQVPDRLAVWAEPLANIVHCFRISMSETPHSMVVMGAGTMGALTVMLAKLRGINQVFVVDRIAARLEAALAIGADGAFDSREGDVVERLRAETGGQGVDFVMDAVGAAETRRAAAAVCRRGGRMAFLGLGENETSLPFIEMIRNEQAIFTSFAYTPRDFLDSVRLIESGRMALDRWTEERPLDEGQASFMKMTHDPGGTLKLLLNVNDGGATR